MKKLTLLFNLIFATTLAGQINDKGELDFDNIRPLDELIFLAVDNAPGMEALLVSQAQTKEEIRINKKKWLRHLALTAGVNYGNGIVSDQLTNGVGTDNRVTYLTRQNITYNLGLNLRLPFTEISSRKHEIKIQKLEIERLEHLRMDQAKLIREEVIRRYKELKRYFISMELQAEVVEANEIALKVAENYFKNGKLEVKEYRLAVDENFTAKLEYEKAKNEAWYCIKSLSEIVGQSIFKQ